MSKCHKVWTGLEVLNLKKWRADGVATRTIAKWLGRSHIAVRRKCHIIRNIVERHNINIKSEIRLLHSRGLCDDEVAFKLCKSPSTIRDHRCEMKLKANRNTTKRPQCMGCNTLSPIAAQKDWTKLTGWSSTNIKTAGTHVRLILCPGCTKVSPQLKGKANEMYNL